MNWKKLGLIFNPKEHDIPWLKSHAMVPTPIFFNDRIRLFYSGRSINGESLISFIDLDINNVKNVLYVHQKPVMEIGKIGAFDDCGTIATCAVFDKEVIKLYYTAYSVSYKVPYKNSIGLAISSDSGNNFIRRFLGPIVDRTIYEPYFAISPWVLKFSDRWHMWYASATDWLMVNGKPESVYHIKYAWSEDGEIWNQTNQSAIVPNHEEEAIARPTVLLEGDKLRMWYTYRGSQDFRDGKDSYRIGYAEAHINNPDKWVRKDDMVNFEIDESDFDLTMQAYPAVISLEDCYLMFYNGNGFGAEGICAAIVKK